MVASVTPTLKMKHLGETCEVTCKKSSRLRAGQAHQISRQIIRGMKVKKIRKAKTPGMMNSEKVIEGNAK